MELFLIFAFLSAPIIVVDFFIFLFRGKSWLTEGKSLGFDVFTLLIIPFSFLKSFDVAVKNDCCSDSAVFSPQHRLSVYILIALCLLAFFYSKLRKRIAPPLLELVVNAILLIALALNVFIAIHLKDEPFMWIVGIIPIIILLLYRLMDNHLFLLQHLTQNGPTFTGSFNQALLHLLQLNLFKKIPLLLLLAVPLLVLFSCLLLLIGQRPDALIMAFTETYKHGLSQLDCSNAVCPDGHFICTVAASGRAEWVKPLRTGVRQGVLIKVNRQLLVANAFESLLEEHLPALHKPFRRLYNRVGGNAKKLYDGLAKQWIANAVYLLLKPLEWAFVTVLYLADRHPENRIAQQYLYPHHRLQLNLA